MLKFTKVEFQLFQDYYKYLFIEEELIWGGITTCVIQAKANNPLPNYSYKSDTPTSFFIYVDVTNLKGRSTTKYLPLNFFKWLTKNWHSFGVLSIPDDLPISYILEVDIEYYKSLHFHHNELSFLSENKCCLGSKQPKSLTTLNPQKKYVCHYVHRKQALNHWLVLTQIHRIMRFNQSLWLALYVLYNTQNVKDDFEKDLNKFVINAMFIKTIENIS